MTHEQAVLAEDIEREAKIVAEAQVPVHTFERSSTFGEMEDVAKKLNDAGYRTWLDLRTGGLYAGACRVNPILPPPTTEANADRVRMVPDSVLAACTCGHPKYRHEATGRCRAKRQSCECRVFVAQHPEASTGAAA